MMVAKLWNRLLGNVVNAPFLETFKSWSSEQSDLAEDVLAHCRGFGLDAL